MQMTDKQITDAVTDVLTHYGQLIRTVSGTQENPRKTTGAITVQFHDDGQYSIALGGCFQKATALGAMFDAMLTLREQMAAQTGQEMAAYIEALSLDKTEFN